MTRPLTLITGAADGIGWATAKLFASRGHTVALLDRNAERLAARQALLGSHHLAIEGDVTDEAGVAAAIDRLLDQTGRLDCVVNNAGIADTLVPTLEQTLEQFRRVLAVHLEGTFITSRAAARWMTGSGRGGVIVNISSIAGVGGLPRRNAYGAAKAGIIAMTRAQACEWGPSGVRVNAVVPGYVETDLLSELAEAGKVDLDAIRRRIPLGRLIRPDDIAEAIWFLASPAARQITGTALTVDGGWTAFGGAGDVGQPQGE